MHSGFRDAWKRDAWVRPFLARYRGVLAAAIALSVIAYVFAAALMFTSGYMISLAATIPFTVLALHVPSLFVRIFGIGKPLVQYVERLSSHDWVLRMTSSLRRRLYDAIERLDERQAHVSGDDGALGGTADRVCRRDASFGRMLALFASDIEHVQDLFLRTILPLVVMIVLYALVVVALGVFSPLMGAVFLVVIGVAVIVMPLVSLSVNGARTMRRQALVSDLYDAAVEDVRGMGDWRLSGRRDDLLVRSRVAYEQRHEVTAAMRAFERRCGVVRQVTFACAIGALFAWAAWVFGGAGVLGSGVSADAGGALGVWNAFLATDAARALAGATMHDATPHAANWIAAFVLCAFPLLEAFAPASEAALGFVRHATAIGELNALAPGGEDAGASEGAGSCSEGAVGCGDKGWQRPSQAVEAPEDARNAIEFDAVSFAYEGGPAIYEGLSLVIPKGQRVAVIGRSGVGKSTLLDLMRGVKVPGQGSVRTEGAIGIIEQEPYVFRKTLRENLLVANPAAPDAQMTSALEAVGLGGLLRSREGGLGTEVAEGGITLSGGERHRLALARILLAESDIVLLDEPYLGLDGATESDVSQVMLDVLSSKTVVVVTHNLRDIDAYDRVVVIGEGGIEADGAPADLARTNPRFQQLLGFELGCASSGTIA